MVHRLQNEIFAGHRSGHILPVHTTTAHQREDPNDEGAILEKRRYRAKVFLVEAAETT